jgi:hypothetical protein
MVVKPPLATLHVPSREVPVPLIVIEAELRPEFVLKNDKPDMFLFVRSRSIVPVALPAFPYADPDHCILYTAASSCVAVAAARRREVLSSFMYRFGYMDCIDR